MRPSVPVMIFAALVSAAAWTQSAVTRWIRGSAYHKAYLRDQRDAVLAHPDMAAALQRPASYHNWKNVWPTFLETAQRLGHGEEMQSKFAAWCGAVAGATAGAVATLAVCLVVGT